jgi:hypothetical protein
MILTARFLASLTIVVPNLSASMYLYEGSCLVAVLLPSRRRVLYQGRCPSSRNAGRGNPRAGSIISHELRNQDQETGTRPLGLQPRPGS